MGDHHELGAPSQLTKYSGESTDILLVEGSVDFVQDAEWRRTDEKAGKEQRHRRQRLFSAGQHGNVLQPLSRRLSHDFDAGILRPFVFPLLLRGRFNQLELRAAASEEFSEYFTELFLQLGKRRRKHVLRGPVDPL